LGAAAAGRPRRRQVALLLTGRKHFLIYDSCWGTTLGRVTHVEFLPERRPDGTIVLRAVIVGPLERLRRLLRRSVLMR
jgi:hypothetical protein